jgi:O6-methylguanine-DNA--protein-cysteine methyltransferase
MITLNIKEKGHLLEIPGLKPFRTPAKVDISKGDIRTIVGHLKVCDITDYEIIASAEGSTEVYRSKDFDAKPAKVVAKIQKVKPDKQMEKRIKKLENMVLKLSEKPKDDSSKNVEQTTNQTEQFQKQILDAIKNLPMGGGSSEKETERKGKHDLDEPAPFIPDIDTEGMKLRGQGEHKTVKKEEGAEDAADALSKLLK